MAGPVADVLHRHEREVGVRIVRITSCVASACLGVYAALAAVGGLGRPGASTAVLWAVAGLALLMAVAWWGCRSMLDDGRVHVFVLAADVGIAAALTSLADPRLTLLGCGFFVIVGAFTGYHTPTSAFGAHLAIAGGFALWAASRLPWDAELIIEINMVLWLVIGLPIVARALWSSERRRADRAYLDPLTNAANRAGLERGYERLCDDAAARGLVVCVIVADIDRFKAVNDRYGHAVGDAVIVAAADHLRTQLGPSSLVARTGGEEFTAVVLGESTSVRSTVARLAVVVHGGGRPTVTMSVGAVWARTEGLRMSLTDSMSAADAAMYRAKNSGGQRLCAAI